MIGKLNKYINSSIVISALLMLLGIGIFIYPTMSLKVFSYSIAIIISLFGLFLIIEDIRYNIGMLFDFSLLGIMFFLLGLILLKYPNTLTSLIPIFLGIWFIVSGFVKGRWTYYLSDYKLSIRILSFIMSILSIVCGIIFIFNPLDGANYIASFVGILLIIYSISDIVDMIIFKINVNKIYKNIKDGLLISIK